MDDGLLNTQKGVVSMATGALFPRRPKGGRGKIERGWRRDGVGELGYKQRSGFTHMGSSSVFYRK